MKRVTAVLRTRPVRRGDGTGTPGRKPKPTPGWKGWSIGGPKAVGWRNPRPPAVPATLDLRLEEYFAAASVMGLLAAQLDEPDQKWCTTWSFQMGRRMAIEARRRRRQPIKEALG